MKLRGKLKDDASIELNAMIVSVQNKADQIAKGTSVSSSDLLRLSYGGKTDTIRKKVVADMATAAEEKLYEKYNQQTDLGKKKNETQD